ncbi:MAG: type II secretion system F family protein, partial [Enterovibrio sp.]
MKISFFQYISQKNRLILYNLLADLLGDGIPLYTALQLVESEDGERVYGKQFIRQLRFILSKMKDSSSVTEVLSEVVPPQDLTVINAAEKSGQLLNGLRMLVSMIEKNNELMVLLR